MAHLWTLFCEIKFGRTTWNRAVLFLEPVASWAFLLLRMRIGPRCTHVGAISNTSAGKSKIEVPPGNYQGAPEKRAPGPKDI